mgnify:CR=1 FL=1
MIPLKGVECKRERKGNKGKDWEDKIPRRVNGRLRITSNEPQCDKGVLIGEGFDAVTPGTLRQA